MGGEFVKKVNNLHSTSIPCLVKVRHLIPVQKKGKKAAVDTRQGLHTSAQQHHLRISALDKIGGRLLCVMRNFYKDSHPHPHPDASGRNVIPLCPRAVVVAAGTLPGAELVRRPPRVQVVQRRQPRLPLVLQSGPGGHWAGVGTLPVRGRRRRVPRGLGTRERRRQVPGEWWLWCC